MPSVNVTITELKCLVFNTIVKLLKWHWYKESFVIWCSKYSFTSL